MSSEKNEHTPGPWKFGHLGTEAFWIGPDYNQTPVAHVDHDMEYARDNSRANARLIAAAPELLEALEGLLVFAEDAETKALVGDEGCLWPCEEARAAIAKARGDAMLAARSENNDA